MFRDVRRYRWRVTAYALGFAAGLLLVSAYVMLPRLSAPRVAKNDSAAVARKAPCTSGDVNEADDAFASPDEVLAALKSEDVGVRREVFGRLFLRPGITTAFYDFERDRDYPERAEDARVQFVNLDDSPEDEAVITFVRTDSPVAVVLKRGACGWRPVAAVSAWLRFEDYPYFDWLELPEAIRMGQHALLVRDSTGDATRYTRRARVLRLVGGRLEQVAEVEEEAIEPVAGYTGADWPQVKRRREASYTLTPQTADAPARLRVEYKTELVRYWGDKPLNAFWFEDDGVWHQARRHWSRRTFTILKTEPKVEEQFTWSEQKNRFVQAGS